ncbi:DUF3575 domain-containing protein [Porphyromonas asaccharolytica]|jgi:hypothetical protein
MKRILLIISLLTLLSLTVSGQQVGVQTNTLYWATTTPNAGVTLGVGEQWSLSLHAGWNPWRFRSYDHPESGERVHPKMFHWTLMPEVKYWFCRRFEYWNLGLHAIATQYNVGGLRFIKPLADYRYQGYGVGAGLSAGYQWPLGDRWGLELSIGVGYLFMKYDKYQCWQCGEREGSYTRHYVGPTKAAIDFIYYIR